MARLKLLLALLVLGFVFAIGAVAITRRHSQIPVGSQVRITLCSGQGCGGWVDPERGDRWCVVGSQTLPFPTGTWSDGVLHGGELFAGTLHFDTDDRATFYGDVDGDVHPLRLERRTNDPWCGRP